MLAVYSGDHHTVPFKMIMYIVENNVVIKRILFYFFAMLNHVRHEI